MTTPACALFSLTKKSGWDKPGFSVWEADEGKIQNASKSGMERRKQ